MSRHRLNSETAEGMEELFESQVKDETQGYYGFEIEEFDYEVEAGEHLLYLDISTHGKATGTSGRAPEFHILKAENQDDLEEAVADLEGTESKTRKFRDRHIDQSSYTFDNGTHYQACTVEKGPWRS